MAEIFEIQPPYQKDTNSSLNSLPFAKDVIDTTRRHFVETNTKNQQPVGTFVPHTPLEIADFLLAVRKNADVYRKAPEQLRAHSIIAVEVLNHNGLLIQYMSAELQRNDTIIFRAIAQIPSAYNLLPEDVRSRPEVIEYHQLHWGDLGLI